MAAFFAEFSRVVQAKGRRSGWSPFQFVDAWRSFVKSVTTGYDGDLDEYQDDLSMRDRLELAVEAPSLVAWPAWSDLLEQVKAADKNLEAAVADGPEVRTGTDWWNARLPAKAGPDLCREAEERYGVTLEVVDP